MAERVVDPPKRKCTLLLTDLVHALLEDYVLLFGKLYFLYGRYSFYRVLQ